MPTKSRIRELAPHFDIYDAGFGGILSLILFVSFATFVPSPSLTGIILGWNEFVDSSGAITVITALTAFLGLYRLRHRPDRTRPAVREDFENPDAKTSTKFGLRNFGPGPALYFQVLATVEQGDVADDTELRITAHDQPIHLCEGDFVNLLADGGKDWLNAMAEKYEVGFSDSGSDDTQRTQPMINLYYSYVSQSGGREPTQISTDQDDEDVLNELKDPKAEVRSIELSRVVEACRNPS